VTADTCLQYSVLNPKLGAHFGDAGALRQSPPQIGHLLKDTFPQDILGQVPPRLHGRLLRFLMMVSDAPT
jgi:hypothetical protein